MNEIDFVEFSLGLTTDEVSYYFWETLALGIVDGYTFRDVVKSGLVDEDAWEYIASWLENNQEEAALRRSYGFDSFEEVPFGEMSFREVFEHLYDNCGFNWDTAAEAGRDKVADFVERTIYFAREVTAGDFEKAARWIGECSIDALIEAYLT